MPALFVSAASLLCQGAAIGLGTALAEKAVKFATRPAKRKQTAEQKYES